MKNKTDINKLKKNTSDLNKYTIQLVDADVASDIRLPDGHSVSYKHILVNKKE